MYLFSFKRFAGHDRIFRTDANIWSAGDLLQTSEDIFLNLWTEISFPELHHHQYPNTPSKILYPWLFDQHFLSFLHRMTYERYASYKSVIKYFISMEIESFLLREQKAKGFTTGEQTLIIFPDNRSRFNMLPDARWASPDALHLISTDTQNKKDLHRRKIKKGARWPIIATHSEVFQPYTNLKKILFVDSHKWYYNNQQDPRYSLPTVVKKIGEIYQAAIEEISFQGAL